MPIIRAYLATPRLGTRMASMSRPLVVATDLTVFQRTVDSVRSHAPTGPGLVGPVVTAGLNRKRGPRVARHAAEREARPEDANDLEPPPAHHASPRPCRRTSFQVQPIDPGAPKDRRDAARQ